MERDRLMALRLPSSLASRLEAAASHLSSKNGKKVSVSEVMRRAIESGLENGLDAPAAVRRERGTIGGVGGAEKKQAGKKKKIRSRRVPEGLNLTTQFREAALKLGLPPSAHEATWAEFKDTEFNVPKSDWLATWRNFCRRQLAWGRVKLPKSKARDFEQLRGLYDDE